MSTVKKQRRLLLLITEDWYFWTHRLPIARAALEAGFEVIVATRVHKHGERIKQEGLKLVPIRLRRKSRNPFSELLSILDLVRIYKKERPDIVHHVTIKPMLYGSWAAVISGVPGVVNAIAGLGHVFVTKGLKATIVKRLVSLAYRSALRLKRERVIFQNPEDMDVFQSNGLVRPERSVLIRGAGVDLNEFKVYPEPAGPATILLAGRLLWNKGVGDLREAGALLKEKGIDCRVVLVGVPDADSPNSVPEDVLKEWVKNGEVEWLGRRDDMPEILAKSNLVVLPTTYGEGVPKILIEAGAAGRAIVASDVAGCREIVKPEVNGILVPPNDVPSLVEAIERLIRNPELRSQMGLRGRELVEREFSEQKVVSETLSIYEELLAENGLSHGDE